MNDRTTPALRALSDAINTVITSAVAVTEATQSDKQDFDTAMAAANDSVAAAEAKAADLQAQLDDLRGQTDPWFQIDKTGTKDVTAAFQKVVAKGGTVPDGAYLLDPLKTIRWTGVLDLAGAKILLKPNGAKAYCAFELRDGCELKGGEIVGDRDQHDFATVPGTHEWGHGVKVVGKGCKWSGTTVRNCTGDGGYIGEGATDVEVKGVTCDNNRRQAISITDDVARITLTECKLLGTNGTSPQAGLDIEPNAGAYAQDILVERCLISGNAWGVNVQSNRVSRVTIKDCTIIQNRSRGAWNAGLEVNLIGGTVAQNGATGVAYATGSSGKVAGVTFDRNIYAKNKTPRAKPITKAGVVPDTANDLKVSSGANVDLSEANTYA